MPELSPELQERLLGYAVNLLGVVVLLFAVWIVGGWARRAAMRGFKRAEFDPFAT